MELVCKILGVFVLLCMTLRACVCQSASQPASVFPNRQYAMLGYNSVKGFPLETSNTFDPGYTLRIFVDSKTEEPDGYQMRGIEGCSITFSSTLVRSKTQLDSALEGSVSFISGLFRLLFSANGDYRSLVSQVTSGEKVLIITKATCNSYLTTLLEDRPPKFDDLFLRWVARLNSSDNENDYFDFLEKYGTHYPKQTKFGAMYLYKFTMSIDKYISQLEQEVDVEVIATLASAFESGVALNYKSSRQAVEDFLKVAQYTTTTIGAAPPPDGSAVTWASSVKPNPAPIQQTLAPIEELFSSNFFGDSSFNYNGIQKKLADAKFKYCGYLKDEKGLVEDCSGSLVQHFLDTEIKGQTPAEIYPVKSIEKCITECKRRQDCIALDYCVSCWPADIKYQTCQMYKAEGRAKVDKGSQSSSWESAFLLSRTLIPLADTAVLGTPRAPKNASAVGTVETCRASCLDDRFCVVFSFCDCPRYVSPCQLYADSGFLGLRHKPGFTTYFLPRP